jgi:Ca2+-binding RTX toxin-like protein
MPNVTLTQQQINNAMRSGFSLAPAQLTFSIPNGTSFWETTPGNYVGGNNQPFVAEYSVLSAAQAAAFRAAILAWDRLIAPTIAEVADNMSGHGEIRAAFTSTGMDPGTAGYAFQGSNQTPTSIVGDIWLNNITSGESFDVGTDNYITLLHEIGHALGLKHPFESPTLPAQFDNLRYTVLSYTQATPVFTLGFSITANSIGTTSQRVIVTTPMVIDIAAIQGLYGADTATGSGDTTYSFTQGDTSIQAIYDSGGIDTIDLANFTRNNRVDLTPGGYSNIGWWTEAEQQAFWQAQTPEPSFDTFIANQYATRDAYEWIDNLGIALSTTIENVTGGSGNDTIIGNDAANAFNLRMGGNDNVSGGNGDDGFYFGSTLDASDFVDGGAGTNDQLALQGNVTLTLLAQYLTGIETLALLAGDDTRFGDPGTNAYSYNITAPDAALASGRTVTVNANGLRANETLTFNASAESDATWLFYSGLGNVNLTGGGGSDGFFFGTGRFSQQDRVVGGAGTDDQLGLRGNYAMPVSFLGTTISGIETIALISSTDTRFSSETGPFSYNLNLAEGNVAAGQVLVITGTGLQSNETMRIEAFTVTTGRFDLRGGAGSDYLSGGAGADTLFGGLGIDELAGNGGNDVYIYRNAAESAGATPDTILGFTQGDLIDLSVIDANSVGGTANDAFTFIGTAAFSNTAGELRYVILSATEAAVLADLDGNGFADMVINLTLGDSNPITSGDFIL